MKLTFGGHWMGGDTDEFIKDQEYDITLEQLDDLSNRFDVMIHKVDILPPTMKKKQLPRVYKKYLYLDNIRGMFRQR